MKLETEKGIWHAHFWHHNLVKPKADGTPRKKVHMATDIVLHPGPCKLDKNKRCTLEGVRAEARQHTRLDTFDKKVGRVVALDRALRGMPTVSTVTGRQVWPKPLLPREVREQIWASYFKQAKTPKSRGSRS